MDSFLRGMGQDVHSVRDVAHEDEGKKDGAAASGTVAPVDAS